MSSVANAHACSTKGVRSDVLHLRRIVAQNCPPDEFGGCPDPIVGSGIELDGTLRRWSDPAVWAELENAIDVVDLRTALPKAGANLTIPPSWDVLLDMDTPELAHIELLGRLSFDPALDVVLSTHTMVNFGGTLAAGNSTHPHPAKVRFFAQQGVFARACIW